MNNVKITFAEKRNNKSYIITSFDLRQINENNLIITDIDKNVKYHIRSIRLQQIKFNSKGLYIYFIGFASNKKNSYDYVEVEIQVEDIKKLLNIISKTKN